MRKCSSFPVEVLLLCSLKSKCILTVKTIFLAVWDHYLLKQKYLIFVAACSYKKQLLCNGDSRGTISYASEANDLNSGCQITKIIKLVYTICYIFLYSIIRIFTPLITFRFMRGYLKIFLQCQNEERKFCFVCCLLCASMLFVFN